MGFVSTSYGVNHMSFINITVFGDSDYSWHIKNSMDSMYYIEVIDESIWGIGNTIHTARNDKMRPMLYKLIAWR